MKKVAVFGKPGSGKSTLSKKLALATGIELHAIDSILYKKNSATYWLVTKRLLKGLILKPEGWPDGSSVLKGTIESYKVLKLCPKFWNDKFLQRLEKLSINKSLHVVRSISELNHFIEKNVR